MQKQIADATLANMAETPQSPAPAPAPAPVMDVVAPPPLAQPPAAPVPVPSPAPPANVGRSAPVKPTPARKQGVTAAIIATVIIVLGLAALAVLAYIKNK